MTRAEGGFATIPILGRTSWDEILELAKAYHMTVLVSQEEGRIAIITRATAQKIGLQEEIYALPEADFAAIIPRVDPPIAFVEAAAERLRNLTTKPTTEETNE